MADKRRLHVIKNHYNLVPGNNGNGEQLTDQMYDAANGGAAAVVAVLHFTGPDTAWEEGTDYLIDWAAYHGGCADQGTRAENLRLIAQDTGNKISIERARYFFPKLPQECYRD